MNKKILMSIVETIHSHRPWDFVVFHHIWDKTFATDYAAENQFWACGYFDLLWCIQGLNTNMLEDTNDCNFFMKRKPLIALCAHWSFVRHFLMQLLFRLETEVSELKWKKRTTFCPQQRNITGVLRPLLIEGACSHTETEHLLNFNIFFPLCMQSLSKY